MASQERRTSKKKNHSPMVHTSHEEFTTPVVEEVLHIGKKKRHQRVLIHKNVIQEDISTTQPLLRSSVDIEHISINRPIDHHPSPRREGNVLIIPIVEERIEIKKTLVLKEELHIRTKSEEFQHPIQTSLRKEQVHIERTGFVDAADEAGATKGDKPWKNKK